ncbi:MAG: hypothetical protein ACK5Q5_16200 [Planctomycetaceae bacterium]
MEVGTPPFCSRSPLIDTGIKAGVNKARSAAAHTTPHTCDDVMSCPAAAFYTARGSE